MDGELHEIKSLPAMQEEAARGARAREALAARLTLSERQRSEAAAAREAAKASLPSCMHCFSHSYRGWAVVLLV